MVAVRSLVFYSWQSDLPNATNRGFIEQALQNAAKMIRNDTSIMIEPVIDRDTIGIPGSPDIAQAIFGKIDQAQVFVCDISIINYDAIDQITLTRPTPNPNVLIELGYALKTLGANRIIMVLNDVYGGPELLPFDLRMRRVIRYHMPKKADGRATERKRLEGMLTDGLRTILNDLNTPLPGEAIQSAPLVRRTKKQSLYELLAQCTVRVVMFDGESFGTGFFVAPGLVLTCTHVVKQAQDNHKDVEISWNDLTFPGHIQAFREDIDLSLLQVSTHDHPCVYLNEEVEAFDNLYTYGYSDRYPEGDAVTFEAEGLHRSKTQTLLVIKGGLVRPGMAGAPVVNVRTGGVCAVIVKTRDSNSPVGSRCIPTRSIFQELSGVGELQKQFHQQDQRWMNLLNPQQFNFWIY